MTLALLCQFTAEHVSDVNTSIFRSLRLLGALLSRLYCAVMIEVYVLIYLPSGKCYTYIPILPHKKNVQESQDTTRLQEHTHSEPHTTCNIGITLTTR